MYSWTGGLIVCSFFGLEPGEVGVLDHDIVNLPPNSVDLRSVECQSENAVQPPLK